MTLSEIVDTAMKASGLSSVAMHCRYVNLKDADVIEAFKSVVDSDLAKGAR